jgi:CNT family concentrative nucleoside transporter
VENNKHFGKIISFFILLQFLNLDIHAEEEINKLEIIQNKWVLNRIEVPGDSTLVKKYDTINYTLDLNENSGYVLEYGTNENYSGSWDADLSKKTFSIKRKNDGKVIDYRIVKYNKNEMVLRGKTRVFIFQSDEYVARKGTLLSRIRGLLGIIVLVFLAFAISNNKKAINWRIPVMGILLQFVFAFAVLRIDFVRNIFDGISSFFVTLLGFSEQGAHFIFGDLAVNMSPWAFVFVFQALPTVVFFSALTSVLYYYGILQKIVYVFAWVMNKLMRLSGAESLAASANIFIGQTEAPLVVKPYIPKMSKSEIMALMTGGMATIAGSVLALYIDFLGGNNPEQQQLFARHLLTASIMNAPASLFIAKILVPETESVERKLKITRESTGSNILDAIAKGTTDGVKLAVNVAAMLLVFIALVYLVNYIVFNWIGHPTGLNEYIANISNGHYEGLNMQYILGLIMAPIAWLIGVPETDLVMLGQLLGEKTILNELFAYTSLSTLKAEYLITDSKSIIIATYALCGFANFASIGIQIGGISAIAPNKREVLSQLGLKALLGGTIATLITASIAGMLI